MPHTVRVQLRLAERDHDALLETTRLARELIRHATNVLHGAPNADLAEITARAPVPPGLPADSLADLPDMVRCFARGARSSGVPLPCRWVNVNANSDTVDVWTPRGDVTCVLLLRPAQRRVLAVPVELTGASILRSADRWFLKLTVREPGGDDVPTTLDEGALARLERDGRLQELRDILGSDGSLARDARNAARLALAQYFRGEVDAAELRLLQLQGQPEVDARVALGLSLVAGTRSDPRRRLEHAQKGLRMRPDSWVRPWLLCSMARALVELGDARQALDVMHEALQITQHDDLRGQARALYYLQGAYAALEDFAAQERYAREALRLFELLGIQEERLSLLMDLAYRRHYLGDREEAWALIQRVVETCAAEEDARLPTALLIRAEFHLLEQRFDEALHDLSRAQHLEQQLRQDRLSVVLRAYTLECRWRLGRVGTDEFVRGTFALQAVTPFDECVVRFYRGLGAFLADDLAAATAAFDAVLSGTALLDSFRVRAAAFRVEIRRRAQRPHAAELEALLQLLERVGGDAALELDAALLQPLYQTLGQRHYRLARVARPHAARVELSVRTLGPFGVTVNGEVVHVRLAKARELLVWLCLHRCGSRDAIMDALWDGAARPGLVSYFKQIVHALRAVLAPVVPPGSHAITYQEQGYALHECFDVRVDAAPFLEFSKSARSLTGDERAAYTAPFLMDVDSEWVRVLREQLHRAALSAYLSAADESLDPRAAVTSLERAVELDPLCEESWMKLVNAWEQLGDSWTAARTRMRCSATFENEFGITPEFLRRNSAN